MDDERLMKGAFDAEDIGRYKEENQEEFATDKCYNQWRRKEPNEQM